MGWDRWVHIVPLRIRSIFRQSRVEDELDEEFRFHLEYRIAREMAAGRTAEEARRTAMRGMHGMEQVKEECRDMRRVNWLDELRRDIGYGLRTLGRSPGFTAAALVALALGIGANTAVFSVVNGVLLRPLPYRDADRLVVVFDRFQQQGMQYGPGGIADFLDWKGRTHSFESIDATASNRFTLVGDGDAEQVQGMGVTASFFRTLGVSPLLGRTFSPGDDQPGRPATAVIGERLWKRRYGADAAILGRVITLNGRPTAVIGVMPASFRFGSDRNDIWSILTLSQPARRGPFFLSGIARLKPGVSIEQATAEMDALAHAVERENPKEYGRLQYPVVGLRESIVGDVRPLLLIFTGAVVLVFLIAVSNVANLMLARATLRRREMAVRLSIGAGRGQVVRQLLTESLLVALGGGALGVALAAWGVATLRWLEPRGLPRLAEVRVDGRVMAFTVAASLASALISGLIPALGSAKTALSQSLQEGGRTGESRRRGRIRGALVIAQVSLSVLLLIGAGLLIRSFAMLGHVRPGFTAPPDRVLTMVVSPVGPRYREPKALSAYWDELLARIRALPGVEAASIAITIPPDRIAFTDGYEIEGRPLPLGSEQPAVVVPFASPDYLRTLGIPVIRGRWFDARDTAEAPRVTVISESMARRHFSAENPVGKRLKHGGKAVANPYMEIIGVVGDVKYEGLDSADSAVYYEASAQSPARPMWLLVRTSADARGLVSAVRQTVRGLDPAVPVDGVTTLAEALAESVSVPRFRSVTMSAFAVTALLLAAVGIYSVITYFVSRRTQEIGLRMALGATPSRVIRMVIGQSGRLAAIGVAIGVAAAFGLTRVLREMVFGVTVSDTLTFAAAVVVLKAIAVGASLAPALRAARMDPANALRHE